MKQLEANHLAEERQLLTNEPASAPTTPTGRNAKGSTTSVPEMQRTEREQPAPIGHGRDGANGAKSMPGSRRTSAYGTFGMEKLSLSVMDSGRRGWMTEEEEVDSEGAQSGSFMIRRSPRLICKDSVKYLGMGDDDPLPGVPKEPKVSESTRVKLNSATLRCFRRTRPRSSVPDSSPSIRS